MPRDGILMEPLVINEMTVVKHEKTGIHEQHVKNTCLQIYLKIYEDFVIQDFIMTQLVMYEEAEMELALNFELIK